MSTSGPEDSVFRLSSGNDKKAFSTFNKIQEQRNNCRVCDLMWRAVERYSQGWILPSTTMFLGWEVDGRRLTKSGRLINRTRRIHLSWRDNGGKDQDVYLVFVASPGADSISEPLTVTAVNAKFEVTNSIKKQDFTNSWVKQTLQDQTAALSSRDAHFLGRDLVNSQDKPALMQNWINQCVRNHGTSCPNTNSTRIQFLELVYGTYFGVIDVQHMQLKALPVVNGVPERYVALSYVWGQYSVGDPYKTTRSNVMIRIQPDGLKRIWETLPLTIKHAMLVVRLLGERYLWVDSLCIIQDSASSWELNAKAMHLVYGNAYFTICAADGDVTAGLKAVASIAIHIHPENLQTPHVQPAEGTGNEKKADHQDRVAPLIAQCRSDVRLLVSRPAEAVIEDSQWNKRAWTFQERLLSPRCLIFAEGQAYFQCRSAVMSQEIFADGRATSWSIDWTNSPLRTLRELNRRAFWFYMKCIRLYTGRQLTKPRDILTAFQGMSWLLQQRLRAPLLYGLPTSHFDLALLWVPLQVLDRRKRKCHETFSQHELGNCNCNCGEDGFGANEFPSWSWCGWMGGKAEYQLDMIEGCLLNVQEWLREHTWILWYFRDHKGNLRPLWDRHILEEDLSEERRWRGYAGSTPTATGNNETAAVNPKDPYSAPSIFRRFIVGNNQNVSQYESTVPEYRRPGQKETQTQPRMKWSRTSNTAYLSQLPSGYYEEKLSNPFSPESMSSRKRGKDMNFGYQYQNCRAPPSQVRRSDEVRSYPEPGTRDAVIDVEDPQDDFEPTPQRRVAKNIDLASRVGVEEEEDDDEDEEEFERSENEIKTNTRQSKGPRVKIYVENKNAERDAYGRLVGPDLNDGNHFTSILPDNPFGIVTGPFPRKMDTRRSMPILQFWTWRTNLYITIRDDFSSPRPFPNDLCQCNIADKAGDWCGSITLPRVWISGHLDRPLVFIAISDAKSMTHDECPVWNYYIPKERDDSEWDLYYVLLLERNRERALWERVGLGKVFKSAFGGADWDEIKLG